MIFGPLVVKKLAKIAEIYGFCSMKPRFLNQITFEMRKALKVGWARTSGNFRKI